MQKGGKKSYMGSIFSSSFLQRLKNRYLELAEKIELMDCKGFFLCQESENLLQDCKV